LEVQIEAGQTTARGGPHLDKQLFFVRREGLVKKIHGLGPPCHKTEAASTLSKVKRGWKMASSQRPMSEDNGFGLRDEDVDLKLDMHVMLPS